jgi:fumarate hydratase class II
MPIPLSWIARPDLAGLTADDDGGYLHTALRDRIREIADHWAAGENVMADALMVTLMHDLSVSREGSAEERENDRVGAVSDAMENLPEIDGDAIGSAADAVDDARVALQTACTALTGLAAVDSDSDAAEALAAALDEARGALDTVDAELTKLRKSIDGMDAAIQAQRI